MNTGTRAAWAPPRPQSNGEVLDTVFRLFLATVVKCLPYGLAAMLLLLAPVLYDLTLRVDTRGPRAADPIWWLFSFASSIGVFASLSAIVLRQTAMLRKEPVSMRRELSDVLRRLPGLTLLFTLSLVVIGAGLAALILPGIYLAIALAPSLPSLLLEERDAIGAMRESLRLTRRNWLRTFLVLAVSFVISLALVLSAAIVTATIVQPLIGGDLARTAAVMLAVALMMLALAAPLFGSLLIAIYGNLRVRRGALDLEQRIATLPEA